jgi:hypothetical protein
MSTNILSHVWDTLSNDAQVAEKWVVAEVTGIEAELASAIALPFWRAIEPTVMADLEEVLKEVLHEAGIAAVTFLTGGTVNLGVVATGLLNKAETIGVTSLSVLEPYALQAWLALKALEAKVANDVAAEVAKI